MLRLGITGSIATGKSTVLEAFKNLGVPVFSADEAVADLYAGQAVAPVEALFPGVAANGVIDKAKLSAALAAEPSGFKRLEAVVHPLVRDRIARFMDDAESSGAALAVVEVPLLFESGYDYGFDARRGDLCRSRHSAAARAGAAGHDRGKVRDHPCPTDAAGRKEAARHLSLRYRRHYCADNRRGRGAGRLTPGDVMNRQIVLDTETTGLSPSTGDRLVEIGCVELINHMPSGKTYHVYLNPQRSMPEEAFRVHGLSDEFLVDKPLFAAVADDFRAFIGDATLIIHNAPFDMGFLNAELQKVGQPSLANEVIDTVMLARKVHPGARVSLDALCKHYGIDNSRRTLHGALLDSEILAEVYLELIGGRQAGLALVLENRVSGAEAIASIATAARRSTPLPSRISRRRAGSPRRPCRRHGRRCAVERISG